MSQTILLVEDDPSITELIRYNLQKYDYSVVTAEDGSSIGSLIKEFTPDLILLDWMLPGKSGIELCREIRTHRETAHLPIIMITARAEEDDLVQGLETGADDYITKPFSTEELKARIASVLRRVGAKKVNHLIRFEDMALDTSAYRVTREDHLVKLGPIEFRLLRHFMENQHQVFSREQLLDRVWMHDSAIDERTVDVHIRRLRKALNVNDYPNYIKTIRSLGYVLTNKNA